MSMPPEIVDKLKELHEKISAIEEAAEPLLDKPPLDRARVDLTTMFTVNSLYWIYQACSGKDPRQNEELMVEVARTKDQSKKFQEVEDLEQRPKVNRRAAKAFVRNALFDANQPASAADEMNDESSSPPDAEEDTSEQSNEDPNVTNG